MSQIKNKFDQESVIKLLKGASIAGGAVAIIYVLEGLTNFDFGSYSELVVGVCAILINTIRVYRQGEKKVAENN